LILDDPVAAAVSANSEQGLGTSRRGGSPFSSMTRLLSTIELRGVINVLSNAYEFERDARGSS
jgi:hypothetical protein